MLRRRWTDAADYHGIAKRCIPMPNAPLHHHNAFELLVATILSAQCTDVLVNMVTPVLFAKYPTPEAGGRLRPTSRCGKDHSIHRRTRSKAKSIRETSADIVNMHGGKVPDSMEKLVALRGVGRKTANVVLGNALGQNVGVVVDTHVGSSLSLRLGLTSKIPIPIKVEHDLMKLVPQPQMDPLFPLADFSRPAGLLRPHKLTAKRANCFYCARPDRN